MGAYNCAKTIGASIESIQAQTFTDWEMIICDDGSVDDSVQIIQSYAEKDPRIKLIANDCNHGLSYTLNHCLEEATGEYCARMDGDDLCDETRFEKQVRFLDENPQYGFVSTTMKRFDEQGIYQVPPMESPYEPTKKDYIKGSPFCHAPAMLRRESYNEVNGYRTLEKVLGVEDYDLWFRLYAKGIKGCILREPLYSMFDGRGAASRRTFKRRVNEAWVRREGYKAIRAPFILRIYVLKPIIIGLIPKWLYKLLKR
jgi:glycosyltransferase EpsE